MLRRPRGSEEEKRPLVQQLGRFYHDLTPPPADIELTPLSPESTTKPETSAEFRLGKDGNPRVFVHSPVVFTYGTVGIVAANDEVLKIAPWKQLELQDGVPVFLLCKSWASRCRPYIKLTCDTEFVCLLSRDPSDVKQQIAACNINPQPVLPTCRSCGSGVVLVGLSDKCGECDPRGMCACGADIALVSMGAETKCVKCTFDLIHADPAAAATASFPAVASAHGPHKGQPHPMRPGFGNEFEIVKDQLAFAQGRQIRSCPLYTTSQNTCSTCHRFFVGMALECASCDIRVCASCRVHGCHSHHDLAFVPTPGYKRFSGNQNASMC